MISVAVIMTVTTLFLFVKYNPAVNTRYAQTVAFTALVMLQMFNALNSTSETESFFKKCIFSNPYLLIGITLSMVLQAAIMYLPWSALIFKVVPLAASDWIYITLASASVLLLGETIKLIKRERVAIKRLNIWKIV